MNEKKYIMAIIKIPIEVKDNDEIEPLEENMDLKFEVITELPEKKNSDYSTNFIKQRIFEILNNTKPIEKEIPPETQDDKDEKNVFTEGIPYNPLPELYVSTSEIQKQSKNKKNLTFRNKSQPNANYTRKLLI
jgi:hypothetical protein